jgi:RNA polymerase sigma-70 factor (ECF subfamily)
MGEPVEQLVRERRYDRALERLMEQYQGKVYRMALVMLRDSARAEDVTQDVFVKLWRALPLYDGRAALGTWLYTIARNTCLSARRADAYRRTAALDDTTEPIATAIEPITLTLEQCVSRLPDVQREVITLFYMQDRSVADVAAMLDLPEGTVKSHLHRARRALGEMLQPRPSDPIGRGVGPGGSSK